MGLTHAWASLEVTQPMGEGKGEPGGGQLLRAIIARESLFYYVIHAFLEGTVGHPLGLRGKTQALSLWGDKREAILPGWLSSRVLSNFLEIP